MTTSLKENSLPMLCKVLTSPGLIIWHPQFSSVLTPYDCMYYVFNF